ncbi:MAG: hypothetical protein MRJ68_18940 [Nitrospira sp.]|nr:hypothetical protein [Nitrospira sp.]
MLSPEQRGNDRALCTRMVLASLTIVVLGLHSGCAVGGGGSGNSGGSGTGGGASVRILSPERVSQDSVLELVDLSLIDSIESGFPALDVKLRNKGDVTAFLKQAEVRILDKIEFSDCRPYMAEPVTWTYDMNLEDPKVFAISQSVPAKGVDRFAIRLGHTSQDPGFHGLYRMRLIITFDEDNKVVESKDFVILLANRMASFCCKSACLEEMEKRIAPARAWPVSYSLPNYFRE